MGLPWLEIALVHYPVLNRRGETIGSAITNLDVHDIARAARTFGAKRYWLITPFAEQHEVAGEILSHWREGYGATANPDRGEALSLVALSDSLQDAVKAMNADLAKAGVAEKATVVATCARSQIRQERLSYRALRKEMREGRPCLLLFGTGWGMAPELLESVDAVLPPILGPGTYNHLSVRSAASIVLDRLMAPDGTVAGTLNP